MAEKRSGNQDIIERAPVFLTTAEVAGALAVSRPTVVNWIKNDKVRYINLPGPRPNYRIPFEALVDSLEGSYDYRQYLTDYFQHRLAEKQ
jgi:excisionase family DNA binding protein